MVTEVPADLELTSLDGRTRSLSQWVTMFHLGLVALDPYTYESAWIIEEAGRILTTYTAADVRVGWLVAGTIDEAKQFLGPWSEQLLTFADPTRVAVRGLGLRTLPAFVHVDVLGRVAASAEGWDPEAWKAVADELSQTLSWSAPLVPGPGAPGPFPGAPV